ncbi:MAG: hypothetical protein ACLPYY_05005, partial [Acidimicrobiales bacterium]
MKRGEMKEQVTVVLVMTHFEKFDGRNCIGPSAPAALAPSCTPGWFDCPLSDSTVPMAARIVQGRP